MISLLCFKGGENLLNDMSAGARPAHGYIPLYLAPTPTLISYSGFLYRNHFEPLPRRESRQLLHDIHGVKQGRENTKLAIQ